MIPLLPSWDENDNMSAPYVGPIKRPAPKGEWENATFSLGPLNYGVPEQHLAQRWWAIYSEIHEGVTYLYIVPANLDGSGWGRPRRILDFYYARIIIGITFGFNHRGLAIIGLHHNDNYGPPNATSVFYPVKDSAGAYAQRTLYLSEAKGVVIACEKPEYVEGVERVTYLFYKDPNNVLTYLTDNGTENWSNTNAVKSSTLGPSWEILHGGYRIDGKFQLGYRHDADDPYPEQPPATPSEDEPDVIPMDLLDTPDTGHTLQSLGEYGLEYPSQVTRANDELEILFYPGGPDYRDNSHLELEGNEVWASSTLTAIGFGFGMWGLDPTTDNMLDHYNCYVELIDGGTIKRAKLVINVNPEDSEHKWFTYAKETTPGRFSTTDLIYPEYSDFYHEYISDNGGVKYVFGSGLPAVDEYYYGTNPGALWLVSIFYPNAAEWPIPISGRTLTFRMKAIPKKAGKTPVQLTMDVHFDIPKP